MDRESLGVLETATLCHESESSRIEAEIKGIGPQCLGERLNLKYRATDFSRKFKE